MLNNNRPFGKLSEQELTKENIIIFFEKFAKAAGIGENTSESRLKLANDLISKSKITEAAAEFKSILEKWKDVEIVTSQAWAGLARCAIAENNFNTAQEILDSLSHNYKDVNTLQLPAVKQAISELELLREIKTKSDSHGSIQKLEQQIKGNPNDLASIYELSSLLFASGDKERAIQMALDLVKKDKNWNEQAARKLLVKFMDALGPNSEIAKKARKQLSFLLF